MFIECLPTNDNVFLITRIVSIYSTKNNINIVGIIAKRISQNREADKE